VTTPTCLFWGSEDPFGDTQFARHLAESLQNGTLEIAFGAGHLPWLDDPEHAADMTRRFLRASGPSVAEPG
jgi:pimeloyl-ACP methyl ester carboxylesterase